MIRRLKEALDKIVGCARAEDRVGVMQSITEFTMLFEEFLRQNDRYIFASEVVGLNRCLMGMVAHLEAGDLGGLVEVIEANLRNFLDDWDFQNKPVN